MPRNRRFQYEKAKSKTIAQSYVWRGVAVERQFKANAEFGLKAAVLMKVKQGADDAVEWLLAVNAAGV